MESIAKTIIEDKVKGVCPLILFSSMKNLVLWNQMNIISLGKCLNEYQKKWIIVIGAGNTYHASHGVDIRDASKKANREWVDII